MGLKTTTQSINLLLWDSNDHGKCRQPMSSYLHSAVSMAPYAPSCLFFDIWTHTHPFNGSLSGTTQVSRCQKGKTNLDFTEARDSEWQWHQLGHMQVSTSLQTYNRASTSLLKFFTGRMPFLPPNQQCQSTEGTIDVWTSQVFWLPGYFGHLS